MPREKFRSRVYNRPMKNGSESWYAEWTDAMGDSHTRRAGDTEEEAKAYRDAREDEARGEAVIGTMIARLESIIRGDEGHLRRGFVARCVSFLATMSAPILEARESPMNGKMGRARRVERGMCCAERLTGSCTHKGLDLYVAREVTHGERALLKIGRSRDTHARLAGIQSGNPREVELAVVVPCVGYLEPILHSLLTPYRLRGEWFGMDEDEAQDVLDMVGGLCDCYTSTEAVVAGIVNAHADINGRPQFDSIPAIWQRACIRTFAAGTPPPAPHPRKPLPPEQTRGEGG